VALEPTAILTLEYLGLLRDAINAFDSVIIAPTTLSTIFQERQFLRVRQPSQKLEAERLQKLITSKQLCLMPEGSRPPRFAHLKVGDDLAEMFRVAQQDGALVVRSAPIHKIGSLMDEEADLTEVTSVLTDTHAVLAFLVGAGKVNNSVRASAEIYLRHVDKGWSLGQPITASSTLYLDDLTVTYLDHVGLLEPLTRSVAAVFVPSEIDERSKAVLRYALLSGEISEAIERIRATLNGAIESGKISLSSHRQTVVKRGKKREDISAPALEIMSDLSAIDVIVVDDRYLNKDGHWTDGTYRVATASTVSVLKALNERGRLAATALWRSMHKLREGGYCLVPIEANELLSYLVSAPTKDGAVVETPELLAIRENLSLIKRANAFVDSESAWLLMTRFAIIQAARGIWASQGDEKEAQVRSDWLLYLLSDPIAWCRNSADEGQWALACSQNATQIALLLYSFEGGIKRGRQYANWINSRLIEHLRATQPWLLEQALVAFKDYLVKALGDVRIEIDKNVLIDEIVLSSLPASVRKEILRDEEFCARLGYEPRFAFPIGEVSVNTSSFYKVLRSAMSKRKSGLLELANGTKIKVRLGFRKPDSATLFIDGREFSFSDVDLLSLDKRVRTNGLRRVFASRPLLEDEQDTWRRTGQRRSFTDREFVNLMTAVGSTPEAIIDELRRPQRLSVDKLVPDEPMYFFRLLAPRSSIESLSAYVSKELADYRCASLKQHRHRALRRIAYSALSHMLVPLNFLASIKKSDLVPLLAANDPFSLLFGFEIAASRVAKDRLFIDAGSMFLERLFADDEVAIKRCTIFSACAMISIVKLRKVFSEQDAPLYWFRLAALAHAGVLAEALSWLQKPGEFLDWASQEVGFDFVWHVAVDRREAPRWDIEWISPKQIQAELLGRVLIVMKKLPAKKRPKKWVKLIEDAETRQAARDGQELSHFFPGPMDDFAKPLVQKRRSPVLVKIEQRLKEAKSLDEVSNLAALAYLEKPSQSVAEEVRRLLAARQLEIGDVDDEHRSRFLLYAYIAASARSEPLAREIINCCVLLIRSQKLTAKVISDLFITIVAACGAVSDPGKYGLILEDAATSLAYAVVEDQEIARRLRLVCQSLSRRDPKLISRLSRAIAIIDAESFRR